MPVWPFDRSPGLAPRNEKVAGPLTGSRGSRPPVRLENFMNNNIVSAVFDSRSEAERAVSELRAAGVADNAISVVAQRDGTTTTSDGDGVETGDDTGGFVKGVAGGAAI